MRNAETRPSDMVQSAEPPVDSGRHGLSFGWRPSPYPWSDLVGLPRDPADPAPVPPARPHAVHPSTVHMPGIRYPTRARHRGRSYNETSPVPRGEPGRRLRDPVAALTRTPAVVTQSCAGCRLLGCSSSSRSCRSTSRSAMVRRSRSMSQWVRTCRVGLASGSMTSGRVAVRPHRQVHSKGISSASTENGTTD
jgi:hypothetical protein